MRNGLYNPDCANSYVWQMIPKNHKPGQNAQYLLTREPSPKLWEQKGFTLVSPVQIGWYNAEGFYCTFRQGVEGCFEDKYFQILWGEKDIEKAKKEYEAKKIEERYGARQEAIV